jgi:hypothetical protein
MKMTPEQKEERKRQRAHENLLLKYQAEQMAARINAKAEKQPIDSSRRKYIQYNGWSKVPKTGQRFRRQGC